MASEDEILAFAAGTLDTVWALELLLTLRKHPGRLWSADELVQELRGSQSVVETGLKNLAVIAVLVQEADGRVRYHVTSAQIGEFVDGLAALYAHKPASVVRAIVTSRATKLQILADAFKIIR